MLPIRNRVEVIIYHPELRKVLLAKWVTPNGITLVFPGGGVEDRETVEDAAVKEALEEVGIKIDKVRVVHRGPIKPIPQDDLAKQVLHRGEQTVYIVALYIDRDFSKHNVEGDAMEFTWEEPLVAQSYLSVSGGEDREHRIQALQNMNLGVQFN